MCLGSSSGAGDARALQQKQQNQIEQGMAMINAIFGGGSTTSYNPFSGTPAPGGQYFTLNSKGEYVPYVPQTTRPGGEGSRHGQGQAWKAPDQLYTQTTQQQQGFGPDFYAARTKAYEDYAMPFLQQQYGNTAKQLKYQLANQGLLGGSAGQGLQNSLQREFGTQEQNVANQAIGATQQLQQQIGQEKMNLIGQLQTSVDPLSTAGQAVGIASQFQAPSPMPAIGNLFQNWANQYLGGQQAQAYNNYANQYLNVLNSFTNPTRSSAGASAPAATYAP